MFGLTEAEWLEFNEKLLNSAELHVFFNRKREKYAAVYETVNGCRQEFNSLCLEDAALASMGFKDTKEAVGALVKFYNEVYALTPLKRRLEGNM